MTTETKPVETAKPKPETPKGKPKRDGVAVMENAVLLPLDLIMVPPDQYRGAGRNKEEEANEKRHVVDLAREFKDIGLIHPITVVKNGDGWELVSGRSRIGAYGHLSRIAETPEEKALWSRIPAVVKDWTPDQAKLGKIAENLTRLNYGSAEMDLAIAAYADTYERLHPETRKGHAGATVTNSKKVTTAAGENSPAAKVKGGAGIPDPTPPPAPSWSKALGDTIGATPRTVQSARKRGKTFTSDDFAVFTKAKVTNTEMDRIAAISDAPKRIEIINLIAQGMPFQVAYDSVMLPEGTTTADVKTNEDVNKVEGQTDEEFLADCPIRLEVNTIAFDAMALLYRRLIGKKEELNKVFKKANKEFAGKILPGGYAAMVRGFISRAHPRQWKKCGTCEGKGSVDKATCSDCKGGGFLCA